jgi:hypothetical protein
MILLEESQASHSELSVDHRVMNLVDAKRNHRRPGDRFPLKNAKNSVIISALNERSGLTPD